MSSLRGLLSTLLPCCTAVKERAAADPLADHQGQQAAFASNPGGDGRRLAAARARTVENSLLETVRDTANSSVHHTSSYHSRRVAASGGTAGDGGGGGHGDGASAILQSRKLSSHSGAVLLDQLQDLRYSLHPNAMLVMSLETMMSGPQSDPSPPLLPLALRHSSPHRPTTISVNQAFELLVGAAGPSACGTADSYIERLLSTHQKARSYFSQKVALALRGPQAHAGAAAPGSTSIEMEMMVEGRLSSFTLTVLPFMASRATQPSTAADVFPALLVELHAELALQLAVQRSSVCMLGCKDPVTMLTMDGQHILWQNYASQVCECHCLHARKAPVVMGG